MPFISFILLIIIYHSKLRFLAHKTSILDESKNIFTKKNNHRSPQKSVYEEFEDYIISPEPWYGINHLTKEWVFEILMHWREVMIQSLHSKISWHRSSFGASLHPSIKFCESPFRPLGKSFVSSIFGIVVVGLGGGRRCVIVLISEKMLWVFSLTLLEHMNWLNW